jgi:hypothetical protein
MTKKLIQVRGQKTLNNQTIILETKAENKATAKKIFAERFGKDFKIKQVTIIKK